MFVELQHQLNVVDEKLTQKNEEMNILLNYKVSNKSRCLFLVVSLKVNKIVNCYFLKNVHCIFVYLNFIAQSGKSLAVLQMLLCKLAAL